MIKYFIIPGYGNSDEDHWQTYFEKILPNCQRINQHSWEEPICEDWINTIDKAIEGYELSEIIFITHSLGGIALAHWAKKFSRIIKGALIVAPADIENLYEEIPVQTFLPVPLNLLPFPTVLAASKNDNWAACKRSEYFAKCWGSQFISIGDAGHINTDSGYGKWDEGLELLKMLE